jgi:hypothetical protein
MMVPSRRCHRSVLPQGCRSSRSTPEMVTRNVDGALEEEPPINDGALEEVPPINTAARLSQQQKYTRNDRRWKKCQRSILPHSMQGVSSQQQ